MHAYTFLGCNSIGFIEIFIDTDVVLENEDKGPTIQPLMSINSHLEKPTCPIHHSK